VQDTLREEAGEISEESLERKVSSKLAHFPRELGHKSQGGIFCFEVLLCYFLGTDRTVWIHIGRTIQIHTGHTSANLGTKIEAGIGTIFEAVLGEFVEGGWLYIRRYHSLLWAHFLRYCFQKIRTVVRTVARISRQICGRLFCVVSGFSLN
jgi:hypothetical protein